VTIHCGLSEDDWTIVGDGCMIMVNAHIAHDCRIGNSVVMCNNAMLAGHITIEDRAYISGGVGVHQFCRVGQLAMVGGHAHVNRDVPPFVTIDGLNSDVVGLNLIGLRRNGFGEREVADLKSAYRMIYRSDLPWREILETLKQEFSSGPAAAYYEFLRHGKRGIMRERRGPARPTIRIFREEDDGSDASIRTAS
jgi:UDP-N-acetylglucosamine acyltransferase